jgi:hypothetical protein
MIGHRPARCKGGIFEIDSDLFAAKGPTSWIIEEVNHFFDTESMYKYIGGPQEAERNIIEPKRV